MKKVLRVCLCAAMTLSLTACLATPPAVVTATGAAAPVQNGVRPAAATGSISGKLVLPYRIQLSRRVAQGGFDVLGYVVGLPAEAQTADDQSDTAPLTEAELSDLSATVDGQPVTIEVTEVVTPAGEDSTEISYTIDEAPVGEGLEVVEITTGEGDPLGGAVVDAAADTETEQDITPESTALLETCVDVHGSLKIAELTAADLALLQQLPALLNKLASIRSVLRKDGTLKPSKMRQFKPKGRGPVRPVVLTESPDPSASPSASPFPEDPKACICPHPRHDHDKNDRDDDENDRDDDDADDADDQDDDDDDQAENTRQKGKGGKGSPRGR